ncbi:hypothetical protein [Natrinema hispanicum]|uniref:FaeA-like protein n=1 Tax=Natrinema hispanicum TaxID=392421 RepID=A0A1I0EYW0_9EURY|nr:hypothetical protein [Natrinema hispanicum]SET50886.1 hypothetical protein SAMN04488694_107179 [Natrinema hispanicum]
MSSPPTKPVQYESADMLAAIRDYGNAAGTADVADAVGCSHDTAYKRLRSLEGDGRVTSRKIGQARVWSVTDE